MCRPPIVLKWDMKTSDYPTLTIESKYLHGGIQGYTTATVTGPEDDVERYREEYFRNWHPMGYGTNVVCTKLENEAGMVTIRIHRSTACS